MRFIPRALTGFLMMLISIGLLGAGAYRLINASPEGSRPGGTAAGLPQVDLVEIKPIQTTPTLTLQGRISAAKETRLSFPVSGRLDQLSERLKTGLRVEEGEPIAQLDARVFERALRTQQLNLASAKANLKEFEARLAAARTEVNQAQVQIQLRQRQLNRLEDLTMRKLASQNEIEAAELALNTAQQARSAKQTAQINAQAAFDRGQLEVERLELAVEQARIDLADTQLRAPFSGVLSEVSVKPGDQVNAGQSLAVLTDLGQLEVSFSTQNPRVIRFLAPGAQEPLPLATEVELSTGSLVWRQSGVLSRVAANGELASGGRQLFATLNPVEGTLLRPGDWVRVSITEPPRDDLAWVPLNALSDDDRVYWVESGRLDSQTVEVYQRSDTEALISMPQTNQLVANIAPRFTDGLPVAIADRTPPTVAELISWIEGNNRMPAERKTAVLEQLKNDPPPELIERLTVRYQSAQG